MSKIHVATKAQARLLLAVDLRALFNLLMARPHSIGEVAYALSLPWQRTYYLLSKLEKAGIASVTTEPARAKTKKLYTVPQPWFIPFAATDAETLETLANAQVTPRMNKIVREALQVVQNYTGERRGYWLYEGNLRLGDAQGSADDLWEGEEPMVFNIGQMNLSRTQASEFKRRLLALVMEFEALSQPEAPPYTLALMLVRGAVDS